MYITHLCYIFSITFLIILPTVIPCSSLQDCVPFSISADTKYVSCKNSVCVCNVTIDCFDSVDSENCSLLICKDYEILTDSCTDIQHDFVIVLTLTIAAGFVGAANIYEHNYVLGYFQIGIFSLCVILSCTICWLQCTTCCGGDSDIAKCVLYITYLIIILIVLLLALTVSAWWVADIIILVLGDKRDGDGCRIIPRF